MSAIVTPNFWKHPLWLAAELSLLFVALPGLAAAGYLSISVLLLVILLVVVITQVYFKETPRQSEVRHWRPMLIRFAFLAPGILLLVYGLQWFGQTSVMAVPDHVRPFGLPREQPKLWCTIMVLYPVLSVWPQEMVYRRFFFRRYASLLGSKMILANAAVFAWAHILFHNGIAIAMTLIGGWLFASTYHYSQSLRLVCVEHALYGCWVFTVGLGWFFLASSA